MDFEHFLREANTKPDYNTNAGSYYKDLARKQQLIELLAKRIWEYDELLDESLENLSLRLEKYINENDSLMSERLKNWDERIENLDEEVSHIFIEWLEDGTLEQIINHDVLGNKADKADLDKVNAQLEQTANNIKEVDYVQDFSAPIYEDSYFKKISNTLFEIFTENDFEGTYYQFIKDNNDEFFKLGTSGLYNRSLAATPLTLQFIGDGWVTTGTNKYTTITGDSYKFTTKATKVGIRTYINPQGGSFDIHVNGHFLKTISTKGTVSDNVIEDIELGVGNHIVEVFFNGGERGWIREVFEYVRINNKPLLHFESNKEFAFTVNGGGEQFWLPDHGIGVMFDNDLTVSINNNVGLNVVSMSNDTSIKGDTLFIYQNMTVKNPLGSNIGLLKIVYELTKEGILKYTGKFISSINGLVIANGYPLMVAVDSTKLNKLVTGFGDKYTANAGGSEHYFEHQSGTSVAYYTGISGYGTSLVAARLDQLYETLNIGKEGVPSSDSTFFVWDRPSNLKTYFRTINNMTLNNGGELSWGASILIRNYNNWSNLMS